MSLIEDLKFSFKKCCPVCKQGGIFYNGLDIVERCEHCKVKLGDHDVGDGAIFFVMSFLCISIVPLAWMLELWVSPPMWVQLILWGAFCLAVVFFVMPVVKAYLMLLEYRHRPGDWKK